MWICFFPLPGVQNRIRFDEPTCPPLKPGTDQIESMGKSKCQKCDIFWVFPQILPWQEPALVIRENCNCQKCDNLLVFNQMSRPALRLSDPKCVQNISTFSIKIHYECHKNSKFLSYELIDCHLKLIICFVSKQLAFLLVCIFLVEIIHRCNTCSYDLVLSFVNLNKCLL